MKMLIKENYFISNTITFLLTNIQYNNQFHVEWRGGPISPTTSIQIGVEIPVVRIWLKELFITRICWLRWLAWWSIIRKIWFRRLFRVNTILIVSKTSISNTTATRRLIISIGITSSCSSIWISIWMHHWKPIKIISTKSTERAITVSKVVIWSIIYPSKIWPWSYTQIL